MKGKIFVVWLLVVSFCMSPLWAVNADPFEELRKEKAAKSNNPLLEEANKKSKKKKKNVIYQWVDEDGKTVISDVPHEGAIEIKLPQPQTYTVPKIKAATTNDNQPQNKLIEKFSRTPPKLKILSPVNDSWLDNNQGNLQVNVVVNPKLGYGQILVIKLDGKEISRSHLSQLNLQGLDRGNHILLVEIQMIKSKKVIAAVESNFNVRRPTVRR